MGDPHTHQHERREPVSGGDNESCWKTLRSGPFLLHVTSDGGTVGVFLPTVVLLPVGALLSVLQAEFVTNLEGLAHSPNDAHGLALRERKIKTHENKIKQVKKKKHLFLKFFHYSSQIGKSKLALYLIELSSFKVDISPISARNIRLNRHRSLI